MTITQQQIRSAAISAQILANIANGMEIEAAWDKVLGAGEWKSLADQVWEANQKSGN